MPDAAVLVPVDGDGVGWGGAQKIHQKKQIPHSRLPSTGYDSFKCRTVVRFSRPTVVARGVFQQCASILCVWWVRVFI